MFDRWHVDKKTTRQSDVRRNPGAFFRYRFLGNLNEYFLSFIQEIRYCRLMTIASRLPTITTLVALLTLSRLALFTRLLASGRFRGLRL
jgi:hypothetical protein